MKNTDFFYINKLSRLHNNKNIFFCKTDYILEDFKTISQKDNEVILITGNSDYAITDSVVDMAPKNIKTWYCQNAISNHSIIYPIPLGMENKEECYRSGHGIGYFDRVRKKETIINNLPNIIPSKFIYANFNKQTNLIYRGQIQKYIKNINYIDWHESNLDLDIFFSTLIQYKMILCPIGNGIDTHRLWETLYCNRVPITIKMGKYKIYELYKKLPIIVLDNIEQLADRTLIEKLYSIAILKKYDHLTASYWTRAIK